MKIGLCGNVDFFKLQKGMYNFGMIGNLRWPVEYNMFWAGNNKGSNAVIDSCCIRKEKGTAN